MHAHMACFTCTLREKKGSETTNRAKTSNFAALALQPYKQHSLHGRFKLWSLAVHKLSVNLVAIIRDFCSGCTYAFVVRYTKNHGGFIQVFDLSGLFSLNSGLNILHTLGVFIIPRISTALLKSFAAVSCIGICCLFSSAITMPLLAICG